MALASLEPVGLDSDPVAGNARIDGLGQRYPGLGRVGLEQTSGVGSELGLLGATVLDERFDTLSVQFGKLDLEGLKIGKRRRRGIFLFFLFRYLFV